jgi:hypothetical protein
MDRKATIIRRLGELRQRALPFFLLHLLLRNPQHLLYLLHLLWTDTSSRRGRVSERRKGSRGNGLGGDIRGDQENKGELHRQWHQRWKAMG